MPSVTVSNENNWGTTRVVLGVYSAHGLAVTAPQDVQALSQETLELPAVQNPLALRVYWSEPGENRFSVLSTNPKELEKLEGALAVFKALDDAGTGEVYSGWQFIVG